MKRFVKILISSLLILATVFSFTACSGDKDVDGAPTGMQVAARTDRYVFFVPENWTVQAEVDGIALAYAPAADRSTLTLYSAKIERGISVDEYFAQNSAEYDAQYDNFTLLAEGKKVYFGNNDAKIYEMTFTANGVGYKSFQCFCIDNGYVYVLTYLAKSEKKTETETYYDENFSQADYTRECFKLTGGTAAQKPAPAPFAYDNTPEGMMLISNTETVDYRLFVPDSWVIDMQTGYTSAYEKDSRASVGVSYLMPSVRTLDEYIETLNLQYGVIYSEYTGMTKGEQVDFGGTPGEVYTYTAVYGGRKIKCKHVFTVVGSYVYTLTYTASEADYDAHIADVDRIISEFEFV